MSSNLYIGIMSGTSLDGLDAVLVDLTQSSPQLIATLSRPFPLPLQQRLKALMVPGNNEIQRMGEADRLLGLEYADLVCALLRQTNVKPEDIRAIGCHGQTIRHSPATDHPFTLQIGDPNQITQLTQITTVADFRRRDMAAGGEGAPLVPAFHHAVFHHPSHNRAIVNIGGMANITLLPADHQADILGYDTGPGNILLDSWYQQHHDDAFDQGGAWGEKGTVLPTLLNKMLSDPFFSLPPPKSTGREQFNLPWLQGFISGEEQAVDIQATLHELTARTIHAAICQSPYPINEVILCGGGAHNDHLRGCLQAAWGEGVTASTQYGIAPQWVEACAFAWLAQRALEQRPGNIPSVTGATEAVTLGAIYQP